MGGIFRVVNKLILNEFVFICDCTFIFNIIRVWFVFIKNFKMLFMFV